MKEPSVIEFMESLSSEIPDSEPLKKYINSVLIKYSRKPIFKSGDTIEKSGIKVYIHDIEYISGIGFVYQVRNEDNLETTIKITDQYEWTLSAKFVSGDILIHKRTGNEYIVDRVCSGYYLSGSIPLFFNEQDDWERKPNYKEPEEKTAKASETLALSELGFLLYDILIEAKGKNDQELWELAYRKQSSFES